MQRTLVMIRHAKSSWTTIGEKDFDRPLNDRGKEDAPKMGERLKKMNIIPDLIIASTAKRAKQTAKKIAEAIGYDEEKIQWEEKLYHCGPAEFEGVIYQVDDNVKTTFIIAHNPGITEFVNQLSPAFNIDNMPTCGAVGAYMETDHWNEFPTAKRNVFLFEYPKKES